jgi:hypothetical protein
LLHNSSCNRNIVEEAEAHWPIWFCVVPGWAHDRERFLQVTTSNGKSSLNDTATT